MSLVSEMKAYEEDLLDKKVVKKILISLPPKYDPLKKGSINTNNHEINKLIKCFSTKTGKSWWRSYEECFPV